MVVPHRSATPGETSAFAKRLPRTRLQYVKKQQAHDTPNMKIIPSFNGSTSANIEGRAIERLKLRREGAARRLDAISN
jgi:hypothetical protein